MKYGAQFFSLRKQCTTPAEIREAFRRASEMGYEVAQASGMGPIDPYELYDISQEYSLPITVTHIPPQRLEEELDRVIAEHRIYHCPVVGLGAMPKIYRDGTRESLNAFFARFKPVAERVFDAGLRFAYHNHAFEFHPFEEGGVVYDRIVEETNWDLIADVCWMEIGGQTPSEVLPRLKGRLQNAHAKDARDFAEKDFCPLGEGKVDLPSALETLRACGCQYCHVEQDNATDAADPFGEMAQSAAWLKKYETEHGR